MPMNSGRMIVIILLTAFAMTPGLEAAVTAKSTSGQGNAVVTVGQKAMVLSGIATEQLPRVTRATNVKAYGEVIGLDNLINLKTAYLIGVAAGRKASYQLMVSRNLFNRTKALFHSSKYVSLQKLQDAEAGFDSDLADSEAAKERISSARSMLLRRWGPVVTSWVVHNAAPAKGLADGRLCLIVVTLPAGTRVRHAAATAEIHGIGGKAVTARLVSVSPVSNPAVQGTSYFYLAPHEPALTTGLNIVATLPIGRASPGVIVPASSVVWRGGKAWAYVKTGRGKFVRRRVCTTQSAGSGWFVKSGVKPGDRVVVRGAQLLLSEEFKSRIQGDDD